MLGGRQHGNSARHAHGAKVCALERIHRDVDFRHRLAVFLLQPDLLADEEHRRFVALALPDDDGAGYRHGVQHMPHGFDRRLVRPVPVAAAHGPRRCDRGLFHHTDKLQGKLFHAGPSFAPRRTTVTARLKKRFKCSAKGSKSANQPLI